MESHPLIHTSFFHSIVLINIKLDNHKFVNNNYGDENGLQERGGEHWQGTISKTVWSPG
jgi:hypothetical protein